DVRVVGDLLRRDPVLPHLLRLRQHLQVAGKAGGDPDADPIIARADPLDRALQHAEDCAQTSPPSRGEPTAALWAATRPPRPGTPTHARRRSRRPAATAGTRARDRGRR